MCVGMWIMLYPLFNVLVTKLDREPTYIYVSHKRVTVSGILSTAPLDRTDSFSTLKHFELGMVITIISLIISHIHVIFHQVTCANTWHTVCYLPLSNTKNICSIERSPSIYVGWHRLWKVHFGVKIEALMLNGVCVVRSVVLDKSNIWIFDLCGTTDLTTKI